MAREFWAYLGILFAPLLIYFHSLLPGANLKTDRSIAFSAVAAVMGMGITVTALLGVTLAVRYGRSRRLVWSCLVAGAVLPGLLLLLR